MILQPRRMLHSLGCFLSIGYDDSKVDYAPRQPWSSWYCSVSAPNLSGNEKPTLYEHLFLIELKTRPIHCGDNRAMHIAQHHGTFSPEAYMVLLWLDGTVVRDSRLAKVSVQWRHVLSRWRHTLVAAGPVHRSTIQGTKLPGSGVGGSWNEDMALPV